MAERIRLVRLGGADQLLIEKPEDLAHIASLDEARWVATSLPTGSLTCDRKFLDYVDFDHNGRIRTDELRAAQTWLFHVLKDRSRLAEGSESLALEAIDASHEEGRALRAAAERLLANLGRAEAAEIALAQVRDRQTIVASGAANGDGIIPPEAAEDEAAAALIRDVIACMGGETDASGAEGASEATLEAFLAEARAHLAWRERGRVAPEGESSEIMVRGEETSAAFAALEAVEAKIDEFFGQCALARLDPRVTERAKLTEAELAALDMNDAAGLTARLAAAPLATLNADEVLPIDESVNPAWAGRLRAFAKVVLRRNEDGRARLAREDWDGLKREFAPFRAWKVAEAGARVAGLGEERLRACLAGEAPGAVRRLVELDRAVARELAEVENVEKLILYQAHLMEFANNFVAFPALYDPSRRSLVEQGTLVMDGRQYTLCVKVADRAAHKRLAAGSHIFVLYVEVTGRDAEKETRFEVAAAVTGGSTGGLCVGKRGIFFTIDGREWDARVVDMVENPVSLGEAVKFPFKRLGQVVSKQFEKLRATFYSGVESGLDKNLAKAQKAPSPAAAPRPGATRDLLMGGGVAIAALGGVFAYMTKTIHDMGVLGVLRVVGIFVGAIAIFTAAVALVKLQRRNLAMLLEACGWAMNARMRLTHRMGRLFTRVPPLPKGAKRRRGDLVHTFERTVPAEGRAWIGWVLGPLLAAAAGVALGYFIGLRLGL